MKDVSKQSQSLKIFLCSVFGFCRLLCRSAGSLGNLGLRLGGCLLVFLLFLLSVRGARSCFFFGHPEWVVVPCCLLLFRFFVDCFDI